MQRYGLADHGLNNLAFSHHYFIATHPSEINIEEINDKFVKNINFLH